ncbi:MAG: CGNR zinc finger domain-containing protein [Acidimicrobiales bacterium]
MASRDDDEDAALVVALLNTVDIDEGIDLLATPAAHQTWAAAHGLSPGRAGLARAVRDSLRALLLDGAAQLPEIALRVGLDGHGTPTLVGDDVAGSVLAAVVRLAVRGDWERVKLCPNPVCLEAFYDHSKNRSRTWCDMAGCGNAAKARSYRARQASKRNDPDGS